MIYEKIDRFCELITLINDGNHELQKLHDVFYEGGYSFSEVYADKLKSVEYNRCALLQIINTI
jgi:hypothetical protein